MLIHSLSLQSSLPWCIVGDFNVSATDKKGQNAHPQWLYDGFKNVILECALTEVELVGGQYTWEKSKGKPNWVREKWTVLLVIMIGGYSFPLVNFLFFTLLFLIIIPFSWI